MKEVELEEIIDSQRIFPIESSSDECEGRINFHNYIRNNENMIPLDKIIIKKCSSSDFIGCDGYVVIGRHHDGGKDYRTIILKSGKYSWVSINKERPYILESDYGAFNKDYKRVYSIEYKRRSYINSINSLFKNDSFFEVFLQLLREAIFISYVSGFTTVQYIQTKNIPPTAIFVSSPEMENKYGRDIRIFYVGVDKIEVKDILIHEDVIYSLLGLPKRDLEMVLKKILLYLLY
ncbi:MAG: hypothetical protein ACP5GJ_04205 [Nanopusillaceae archaeon]|jgi:hypothetical protein